MLGLRLRLFLNSFIFEEEKRRWYKKIATEKCNSYLSDNPLHGAILNCPALDSPKTICRDQVGGKPEKTHALVVDLLIDALPSRVTRIVSQRTRDFGPDLHGPSWQSFL